MNREEAINMTREIRGDKQEYLGGPGFTWDELVEFANRVVAAEREAILTLADEMDCSDGIIPTDDLKATIRARSDV